MWTRRDIGALIRNVLEIKGLIARANTGACRCFPATRQRMNIDQGLGGHGGFPSLGAVYPLCRDLEMQDIKRRQPFFFIGKVEQIEPVEAMQFVILSEIEKRLSLKNAA